jgi:hypothetical protein
MERFSWFQKTLSISPTLVEKGVPHDYSNLITLFISKVDFHNPDRVPNPVRVLTIGIRKPYHMHQP